MTIINFSNSYAQFNAGGNIESGYYKSVNDFLSPRSNLFFAVEAKLGYKYKGDNTEASLDLKGRPEWFGVNRDLYSFKFKGSGFFLRREESLDWALSVTRQLNRISGSNIDIDYDIFSLTASSNLYFWEGLPLSLAVGYAYQTISSLSMQDHDIVFCDLKTRNMLSPYFSLNYGLYFEKFTIEGETIVNYIKTNETNSGFRIGPVFEFNFIKNFVINGQYRLLLNFSDYSKSASYEHWVRLVAGKILPENFSVFLLVDYFWRDIKNAGDAGRVNILYSPFNRENNFSIKIGYELSDNCELYLKTGYFRNDLVYNDYTFEGWNVLLGTGMSF